MRTGWPGSTTNTGGSAAEKATLGAFDLNGCLKSRGGPVGDGPDVPSDTVKELTLVLDTSRSQNILCCLADYRDDPLANPTQAPTSSVTPNVAAVEVLIHGAPRIAIVTTTVIAANDELRIDTGEAGWISAKRIHTRASTNSEFQNIINDREDRIKTLETDYNTLIVEHKKFKNELNQVRGLAATVAQVWSEEYVDENDDDDDDDKSKTPELFQMHQPGTLNAEEIATAYAAEDKTDADKAIRLSDLQSLVFKDDFRPQKPQERGDAVGWVDNDRCRPFMELKAENMRAANEVVRAWDEMQKYQHLVPHSELVPWNAVHGRPLSPLEIAALLTAHTYKKTDKLSLDNLGDAADDDNISNALEFVTSNFDALTKRAATQQAPPKGGSRTRRYV